MSIVKRSFYLILVIFLFFIGSVNVNASSGALKKNSIKTCPNGKIYGYHGKDNHWHEAERSNVNSGYSAVGSPLSGDPCPKQNNNSNNSSNNNINNNKVNSNTNNLKSGDNTLKQLIIDDKNIDVEEKMYYSTDKETVTIDAVPNNGKASVIVNNVDLKIGDNEIIIEVVTEDGAKRNYILVINRKIESIPLPESQVTEKSDELSNNDDFQSEDEASLFTGVLTIGILGYGLYYLVKKIKRK